MSKGSKRHTHKYYHAQLPFGHVWACALPDCQHHMPNHYESLLLGKSSICWECGNTFKLNGENMKQDKPICEGCKIGISDEIDLPLSNVLIERLTKG